MRGRVMVTRWPHKPKSAGSSPASATSGKWKAKKKTTGVLVRSLDCNPARVRGNSTRHYDNGRSSGQRVPLVAKRDHSSRARMPGCQPGGCGFESHWSRCGRSLTVRHLSVAQEIAGSSPVVHHTQDGPGFATRVFLVEEECGPAVRIVGRWA